jgi:hypothetical protein
MGDQSFSLATSQQNQDRRNLGGNYNRPSNSELMQNLNLDGPPWIPQNQWPSGKAMQDEESPAAGRIIPGQSMENQPQQIHGFATQHSQSGIV